MHTPSSKQEHPDLSYYQGAARPMSKRVPWGTAALFFMLLALLGTASLYFAWDYLPERVQYIPRYLETRFLPSRPHPEFVATPVGASAPEQALQNLLLATPVAEEAAPSQPVAGAEGSSAPPEVAAPQPTPLPLFAAAGPRGRLSGVRHEYQGWNNCGPATLAMNLSYFGRPETQAETAPFLKPNKDDKNVSPDEMLAYAHSIGYGGQVVVGGDLELLRTLVTNGLPVIVESWYIPDPNDEMGHYLLLTGYDGEALTFFDSYHGPDVQENAAQFDQFWKVFNRTAVVIWPAEKAEMAQAILGDLTDERVMHERARDIAHAEVNRNPQDKFAWFNLGSSLIALGDSENAVKAFTTARSLQLPWRMLWYQFTPYEAYYAQGSYQELINLATATLQGADNLEESYYWRGRAYAALGQTDAARRDLQQALNLNPNFIPAQESLTMLP